MRHLYVRRMHTLVIDEGCERLSSLKRPELLGRQVQRVLVTVDGAGPILVDRLEAFRGAAALRTATAMALCGRGPTGGADRVSGRVSARGRGTATSASSTGRAGGCADARLIGGELRPSPPVVRSVLAATGGTRLAARAVLQPLVSDTVSDSLSLSLSVTVSEVDCEVAVPHVSLVATLQLLKYVRCCPTTVGLMRAFTGVSRSSGMIASAISWASRGCLTRNPIFRFVASWTAARTWSSRSPNWDLPLMTERDAAGELPAPRRDRAG
jgi:hypothetical protein